MDKMLIGQQIRNLMEEKNLDKQSLAKDLEITERALESYIYGSRIPSDIVKYRIARYFGKTVDEIFFNNSTHSK